MKLLKIKQTTALSVLPPLKTVRRADSGIQSGGFPALNFST
jgi:hypothetical protein